MIERTGRSQKLDALWKTTLIEMMAVESELSYFGFRENESESEAVRPN